MTQSRSRVKLTSSEVSIRCCIHAWSMAILFLKTRFVRLLTRTRVAVMMVIWWGPFEQTFVPRVHMKFGSIGALCSETVWRRTSFPLHKCIKLLQMKWSVNNPSVQNIKGKSRQILCWPLSPQSFQTSLSVPKILQSKLLWHGLFDLPLGVMGRIWSVIVATPVYFFCTILTVPGYLILKRKILKRFYHIWAWQPSWPSHHHHLNKLLFPQPTKAP